MLWEVILLILSVTLLCTYSLLMDFYAYWLSKRRGRALDKELHQLEGKKAWDAERRFGPPTEIVHGSTGRQLYIWKSNDLPHIPHSKGLLVVTLTIGPDSEIAGTHWQNRGAAR